MNHLWKQFFIFLFILLPSLASGSGSGPSTDGDVGGDSGGSKQTWQEIMKNPNLRARFPMYFVGDKKIRYDHLCLAEDELIRSKYKQRLSHNVFEYIYTERITQQEVCFSVTSGGQCTGWQTIDYEIPLKNKVQVYKKTEEDPDNWSLAFTKEFELKECETW